MDKKLKEAVAEKYELHSVKPGVHNFANFGQIDLCALGLAEAKILVKAGFPYLKEKPKVVKTEKKNGK